MDSSLNQQIYEILKKDIMTFALKPSEAVSAAKLAERYNVSRTPVREALVKLETQGLVEIYPQSKSLISAIDVERAKQEWFIRVSLETSMVEEFFAKVTDEDIAKMKDICEKFAILSKKEVNHETSYEYLCLDNEFHAVTYEVAGERLAAEVISNTMAHYNRIRLLVDMENTNKERTIKAHEKLVDYVINKDIEGYKRELETHLHHIVKDIELMRELFPMFFKQNNN